MLETLAENDAHWRELAYNFCKDKTLADDIVQDMYLKVLDYEVKKEAYIYFVIRSLFIEHCRREAKRKTISIDSLHYLKDNTSQFEIDDNDLDILNRYNNLNWKQKELIELSYDKSLRQIEKEYPLINYGYAHRQIKTGRDIILKNERTKR